LTFSCLRDDSRALRYDSCAYALYIRALFFSHFHPHANERYAQADELGTPYGVTVDFSTLEEGATVTLRDRDTSQQIRLPISAVVGLVKALVEQHPAVPLDEVGLGSEVAGCLEPFTWADATSKFPVVEASG